MKRCRSWWDPLPPPNHDEGRVMASCTLRMHLKGRLSINLVVLVVILLLDGENFLMKMFSCLFSAFQWRRCFALVRRISVKTGVLGVPLS